MSDHVPLRLTHILHGGDYNPEQWPGPVWDEDIRLMKVAGVNIATLPVFGWSALQPDEEVFTFDWLDRILDELHAGGIGVALATPTAAIPPWMARKYPDVLVAGTDGRRRHHGNRQNTCPNSPSFRRLSAEIAGKMAERYGRHPALVLWHVSNEYGAHCYCDACAGEFRRWLRERYGTLDELNARWYTSFWGHRFTDWSQVEPPYSDGQMCLQAIKLDYDRFQSHSILGCYRNERAVLRRITPTIPITTNMMGSFKPLNYHEWADDLDVVAWDSYPSGDATPSDIAFPHALMRGLRNGEPWLLLEQTPSQQNWQAYNSLKRPGILRLWSFQAIAHGSDAVMYFQWRQSRGGVEKFHGGIVSHDGTENARVFREVAALGAELKSLGAQTLDGRVLADAAILFDWENWWAMEYSIGPSRDLKYLPQVKSFYAPLHELNITADVMSPDADLSPYKLVLAPLLYMVRRGVADRLERFVMAGGTLVISYFSGIVDENDRTFPGGFPGPLRKLAGVWAEELDPLFPEQRNSAIFAEPFGQVRGEHPCRLLCERIHLESATALATYGMDFYAGEPAITRNAFGRGSVYYIATALEPDAQKKLLREIAARAGVHPVVDAPPGIEATRRRSPDGKELLYLLNHGIEAARVNLPPGQFRDLLTDQIFSTEIPLDPRAVRILATGN